MSLNGDPLPGYHVGHLVFEHLSRHLDNVCQIDAATGEEETYGSVLKRSIQLSKAIRAFGLKPGDVLAIGGRNHLDICIPFYAALFNGLPILGVDPYFKYDEVRLLFKLTSPKIAFCQNESYEIYANAAADLGLDVKLVTFDKGDFTMSKFIEMYDAPAREEEFKMAEFDLEKIYAYLLSTSGTTGKVKVAAFNHKNVLEKYLQWLRKWQKHDFKQNKNLVLSPINWMSHYFLLVAVPFGGDIKIQTSTPDNYDHVIDIINKYRPDVTMFGPTLIRYLIDRKNDVDLSCFKNITVTGSKIFVDVLTEFKKLLSKSCIVTEAYGQTEMFGPVLKPNPFGPAGNCGVPTNMYSIKLVDPDTGVEIKETNVTGELLAKGPGFSEYYNDPEATAQALTEDGFYKSGDLLYFDESSNYYFVDRIKSLIKYRNSHVLPTELEELINKHPGVQSVCVVGINDPVDGQRPAACVVKENNSGITAQEIKDLVASKLSKNKQLRGGVIFVDALPLTSTGKVALGKIKQLVSDAQNV